MAFSSKLCSAQYSAKATLDSSFILIGKQSTLTLELSKPLAAPLQWPAFTDTLGGVEVITAGPLDTLSSNNSIITLQQKLKVTAFDSGFFVIPPVNFYKSSTDTAVVASTNPLLITVQIMPVDTTKAFMDIKSVREVPFNWRDYILYIIIGIVILHIILIGLYLYFRYKKKKKLPGLFKQEPVIAPHVEALNKLKEIDNEKYWQNGQYKLYHSLISDTLRYYIERQWNVPAMEQTTDEILSGQMIGMLDAEVKQPLNFVLRIADLAKFAKLQPLANENEQSMRNAIEFVNMTTPQEKPVTKEVQS